MSIDLTKALLIQRNNVRTFALGPFDNGKYGSVTYLMKGNIAGRPVLSIQKGEFDNCKKAIDELDNIVKKVRELDLPSQIKELDDIYSH